MSTTSPITTFTLTPFENHQIRSAYDTNTNKHYFSVVDICAAICGSGYQNARNYYKWLKNKLFLQNNPLVTTIKQLKFESQDGKLRFTDVMDVDDVLRLIQLFPSSRNGSSRNGSSGSDSGSGSGNGNRIDEFRLWIAELVISGKSVTESLLEAVRKAKNIARQRIGGFMRIVRRKCFDVSGGGEDKPITQEGLTSEQLEVAKNVLLGVERITENGLSRETLEAFESLERGDFKLRFEERLP